MSKMGPCPARLTDKYIKKQKLVQKKLGSKCTPPFAKIIMSEW